MPVIGTHPVTNDGFLDLGQVECGLALGIGQVDVGSGEDQGTDQVLVPLEHGKV